MHINLEREVYNAIAAGHQTQADILGFIRKTEQGQAHLNLKRILASTLKKLAKQRMIKTENKKWIKIR